MVEHSAKPAEVPARAKKWHVNMTRMVKQKKDTASGRFQHMGVS